MKPPVVIIRGTPMHIASAVLTTTPVPIPVLTMPVTTRMPLTTTLLGIIAMPTSTQATLSMAQHAVDSESTFSFVAGIIFITCLIVALIIGGVKIRGRIWLGVQLLWKGHLPIVQPPVQPVSNVQPPVEPVTRPGQRDRPQEIHDCRRNLFGDR